MVLDTSLTSLPIVEADLGLPWSWRIAPASRPVSDEIYVAHAFRPEGVELRPLSVAMSNSYGADWKRGRR